MTLRFVVERQEDMAHPQVPSFVVQCPVCRGYCWLSVKNVQDFSTLPVICRHCFMRECAALASIRVKGR